MKRLEIRFIDKALTMIRKGHTIPSSNILYYKCFKLFNVNISLTIVMQCCSPDENVGAGDSEPNVQCSFYVILIAAAP